MDHVGKAAHTDHGLGTITEVDSVRGSRQFRVAGRGFDVWVPEIRLRLATSDYTAGLETTIDPGGPYEVNDDNSTTLPYDPSPQYPVDLFAKEQTILPGDYEIDPDDRLHPSDSLSKNRADANRPYPGPSPDLFAKGAARGVEQFLEEDDDPHGEKYFKNKERQEYQRAIKRSPGLEEFIAHPDDPYHEGARHYAEEEPFQGDPYKEWGEDDWHSDLPDGPERTFDAGQHSLPDDHDYADYEQPRYSGGAHEAWEPQRGQGPGHGGYYPGKQITMPNRSSAYRPAGLSDRYAYIIDPDDERDPNTAFRRDPIEFMERRAYVISAGEEDHLYKKFADYDNLLAADPQLRTAAWNDVRQKAQRLRHEGRVHINHVTPQHVYATVDGDTGTYDTMIIKGASGAFSGGQSIANWSCDCEWGKWAFQRKVSYVGRLCSHAYAAYLDMQSHYQKDNQGRFKSASIVDDFKSWAKENNDGHMDRGSMTDFINTCDEHVTKEQATELYNHLLKNTQVAPERDYDIPYTFDNEKAYKTGTQMPGEPEADPNEPQLWDNYHEQWTPAKTGEALRQRPLSLTPDLREVPQDDENKWTDVTEDDRKTTGPEQIVHFGAIASMLHTADGETPFGHGFGDVENWWNSLATPDSRGYGHQNDPQPVQPAAATQPAPVAPDSRPGFGPIPVGPGQPGFQGGPGQPPGSVPAAKTAPPPAGATPTKPTWFPGQESTTSPTSGPWQQNKNQTALTGNSYQIQHGDTLNDIAQRSGLSVQDLAKANNIQDVNKINAGDTLKMPGAKGPAGGIPSGETFNALSEAGNALDDQGKPKPAAPGAPKVPSADTFNALSQAAGGTPGAPGAPPASGMKTVGTPPAPPAVPQPPKPPGASNIHARLLAQLHHAADDDNDDDERRPDTGEAAAKLDRLRQLCDEDQSDHYQDMDSYNEEIRDLVEELQDAGVDAMPFVASRRAAVEPDDPADANANFSGRSAPDWADEPFNGSGPDPQLWMGDSASWIDEHERPDFDDVTDLPDGDIIKFNDSRSAPQQGPRHGSRYADNATIGDYSQMNGMDPMTYTDGESANGGDNTVMASLHYADDNDVVGDGTGYFNSDNPSGGDWEEGSGTPFMNEVGHQFDQNSPHLPNMGGGGDGGEAAEGGELAEEAPELLALASRQSPNGGFSLEAFDRGEFSIGEGGELRQANRVGGGPTQRVRVDPGGRGWKKQAETYNPPEDFGNDGDPDLATYSGDAGADPGMTADIVASFQRSAGALSMMHGQSQVRPGSIDDFSSSPAVQAMLRTAGRKFSPEEEHDLEMESHVLGARNLPTQSDLAGTHYLLDM